MQKMMQKNSDDKDSFCARLSFSGCSGGALSPRAAAGLVTLVLISEGHAGWRSCSVSQTLEIRASDSHGLDPAD